MSTGGFPRRSFAAVCVFLTLSAVSAGAQAKKAADTAATAGPGTQVLRDFDDAIDALAERMLPCIVQIEVSGFGPREDRNGDEDADVIERQRAIGSGVIVEPDGYIMTNAHVVRGAQRIQVVLTPTGAELAPGTTALMRRQRRFDAKLLGLNRMVDLALLKIDATDLAYIPLKQDFRIHLGQTVLAVGSPEGLEHTVTRGIVSAVGRQPDLDRPMIYVQTDAPINPGNSGGALIDRDGNLVGINTFILTEGGGSEGLGFAIPEPTVRFVYHELREHGRVRQTTIGANAQTITHDIAEGLKLSQDWGVVISDVVPGGPADKAGLKPKDIVIGIDGRPVDSLPKYSAFLYLHRKDEPVQMAVSRKSDILKLQIAAVEAHNGAERLSDLVDPQKDLLNSLGVFALNLDHSVADVLPDLRSSSGVIVAARVDYEPKLDVDLSVGDVIRSINGTPVTSVDMLRTELDRHKPGDSVVLEVERQGVFQFVGFQME